jgi:hypothetical protein
MWIGAHGEPLSPVANHTQVLSGVDQAPVTPKMSALLAIADKVRRDGKLVQAADVERARAEGADDKAIHDTVLIAAAFCMFNRYVLGLGTWAPEDPAAYVDSGVRLAEVGYARFDFSKIRGEWPNEGGLVGLLLKPPPETPDVPRPKCDR